MDNKQIPETNDDAIEAVIAESAGQAEAPPKRGKGLLTRVLVLLFVVVALVFGTLAAGGHLQPLLQKITASFDTAPQPHATMDSGQVVAETPAAAKDEAISHEAGSFVLPVTAPVAPVVEKAPVEPVAEEPAAVEEPAVAPVINQQVVGKAEIDRLMATIDTLSGELAMVREAQGELKTSRARQQQMDLQVRTGWLVDPAISLQQMQQAWEEIALLPGLTAGQRDEANRMHALATRTAREVKQWRETLVKWADMMVVPVHPEMLPQPEHPWLAWIVGQFHLHRAPSAEADRLSELRTRLLDAARHLSLEAWPDKATWQALHAELLLQVRAFSAAKAEPMPELGLPENLDALQQDIAVLHNTALSWKARGQEGI